MKQKTMRELWLKRATKIQLEGERLRIQVGNATMFDKQASEDVEKALKLVIRYIIYRTTLGETTIVLPNRMCDELCKKLVEKLHVTIESGSIIHLGSEKEIERAKDIVRITQ